MRNATEVKNITIAASVPSNLHAEVQTICERSGASVSAVMRLALSKYASEYFKHERGAAIRDRQIEGYLRRQEQKETEKTE